MARTTESAIHYLHPDGWSSDPTGASVRIRSRVARQSQTVGEFAIEEPDGRGGWREVDAPPPGRIGEGWQWFAWQAMRRGVPLVCFRGVRPMDQAMATSLCDGLVLHSHGGRVLNGPAEAGMSFALGTDDAREFHRRVHAAGGQIIPTVADLGQAGTAARTLASAATSARATATEALALVADGRAPATATVTQFDALVQRAWEARRTAQAARAALEEAAGELSAGRSTHEAVSLQKLMVIAAADWQAVEDAIAEVTGAQAEAAAQFAAQSGPGSPPLAAPFDQWFGHIAARCRAQGQDARVIGGELVIETPDGRITLGRTARIARTPE